MVSFGFSCLVFRARIFLSCFITVLDMFCRGVTCTQVNFFLTYLFLCLCDMEVGLNILVVMEVGKGGLSSELV